MTAQMTQDRQPPDQRLPDEQASVADPVSLPPVPSRHGVARFVLAEVSVCALVVAAWLVRLPWLAGGTAAGALVLLAITWRIRGLGTPTRPATPGQPPSVPGGEPAPAERPDTRARVAEVLPELGIVVDTGVEPPAMGVVRDGDDLIAVLGVRHDDLVPASGDRLGIRCLTELLAGLPTPLSAVQLLVHTAVHAVPGDATTPPGTARTVCVVLRLDPNRCAAAVHAAGGGRLGGERLLRGTVDQAGHLLARQGIRATVLSAVGVSDVLDRVLATPAVAAQAVTTPADAPAGGRADWRYGGVAHTAYTVRGWRADAGIAGLFASGRGDRAATTTVSVLLTPGPAAGPTTTVLLRTSVPVSDAASRHRAVTATATRYGLRIQRWDGAHRDGVLATLPLARIAGRPSAARRTTRPVCPPDATVMPTGLLLGTSARGPVLVRLFVDRSVRGELIGSTLLAELFAVRAATAGVEVHVITATPPAWGALARALTTLGDRVRFHQPGSPPPPPGVRPRLVLNGADEEATAGWPRIGWQAVVTVRTPTGTDTIAALSTSDFTLIENVSVDALVDESGRLPLPPGTAQWLLRMPDDVVAMLVGRQVHFAQLGITPTEQALLAEPVTRE